MSAPVTRTWAASCENAAHVRPNTNFGWVENGAHTGTAPARPYSGLAYATPSGRRVVHPTLTFASPRTRSEAAPGLLLRVRVSAVPH